MPLGVIGAIYESRPNITVDFAALCIKSGNAVILRGGKEAVHSNGALAAMTGREIVRAGVPAGRGAVHRVDRQGAGGAHARNEGSHRPDSPPRRAGAHPPGRRRVRRPRCHGRRGSLPHLRGQGCRYRHGRARRPQREGAETVRLQRDGHHDRALRRRLGLPLQDCRAVGRGRGGDALRPPGGQSARPAGWTGGGARRRG